jgi:hypothetical protein
VDLAGGMLSRRTRAFLCVVSAVLGVIASPSRAGAAEGDITFEIVELDIGGSIIPHEILFDDEGELRPQPFVVQPAGGCVPYGDSVGPISPTSGVLCMGAPVDPLDEPVVIYDGSQRPTVPYGEEARDAIGWIVEEALEAIRAAYGVPLDGRIQRYAQPEIRAYVIERIGDILDRAAYGVELTPNEQRTLEFMERVIGGHELTLARAAWDEYQEFQNKGCAYTPPAAPAWVTEPVGLPDEVRNWCLHRTPQLANLFVFAPPQPTAEHFQVWASYRHAEELGLNHLGREDFQELLSNTAAAGIVLGGLAAAAIAAGATFAAVGSSVALAAPVIATFAVMSYHLGWYGANSAAIVSSVITGTGAGMAAAVVGTVITFIVVTAVSIVQLVQYLEVGRTLEQRKEAAENNSDPLGVRAAQAVLGGRPLRDGLDPGNPPSYRSEARMGRLSWLVTMWLSMSGPFGTYLSDEVGVWSNHETTERDYRFRVFVDGEDQGEVDEITVPAPDDGSLAVRFNRSWLVVTPQGGSPRAALWFPYLGPDGVTRTAARTGGTAPPLWTITTTPESGPSESARLAFLEYLDDEGRTVRAYLVAPESPLSGPRPTVAGPLVPGRVANLRPNPIAEDGSFDLDRFRDDYGYQWTVQHFDPESGEWESVPVENATQYGARFIPEVVGDYRAVVTMTDLVDQGAEPKMGAVEFRVSPPVIEIDRLELVDTGGEDLQIRAQFHENVPTDELELTVRWPGEFGGEPVETTVELECTYQGLTCDTIDTDADSTLRNALRHTLATTSDLSHGVSVTVQNSHGGVIQRDFDLLDHPDRPRFAPSTLSLADGQLGSVDLGRNVISVRLVAEADTIPSYPLASVVLSDAFEESAGIWDANGPKNWIFQLPGFALMTVTFDESQNGSWELALNANGVTFDHVGTHEFAFAISQDGKSGWLPFLLRIEVVPTQEERYRAVLANELDPQDFGVDEVPELWPFVIGGMAEWGDPEAELCVGLGQGQSTITEQTAVRCGPIGEMTDEDGAPLPFPYRDLAPEGLAPGGGPYWAHAWLEDAGSGGDRISEVPHTVSFLYLHQPPSVTTLEWDETTGSVVFDVEPGDEDTQIADVRCELDGEPIDCWDDGEWTWPDDELTEGEHELVVSVDDSRGNYTTRALTFTVEGDGGDSGNGDTGDGGEDTGDSGNGDDSGNGGDDTGGNSGTGNNSSGDNSSGSSGPGGNSPGSNSSGDRPSDGTTGAGAPPSGSGSRPGGTPTGGGGRPAGGGSGGRPGGAVTGGAPAVPSPTTSTVPSPTTTVPSPTTSTLPSPTTTAAPVDDVEQGDAVDEAAGVSESSESSGGNVGVWVVLGLLSIGGLSGLGGFLIRRRGLT